jgi:hypothetical protein
LGSTSRFSTLAADFYLAQTTKVRINFMCFYLFDTQMTILCIPPLMMAPTEEAIFITQTFRS